VYLIPPHKPQFKANLHSHSTRSDGRLSPEQLVAAYREHGYDILAITDHEAPKNHSEFSDDSFLLITGYEAYIRDNPECRYDVFASEIHLNLFARDPENETIIGYDPPCCKYLTAEQQDALKKAEPLGPRSYSTAYINRFIRSANENGYLVSYNHPVWSMESTEHVLSYDGIFSMEMINYNSYTINRNEYNGALYDALLRNEKTWFVHAADDNHNVYPHEHPQCDSFGAFTMIVTDELTYPHVIDAMATGDMYASSGPIIHELSVNGNEINIRCSPAQAIICHDGSKHPPSVQASEGDAVECATFKISEKSPYIRITVIDDKNRRADTRGYFRKEWSV